VAVLERGEGHGLQGNLAPVRRLSTLLILGALGLAGCGSSPQDDVKSTVTSFRDATAARDYAKICKDVLAPDLVRRLDDLGLPCEVALSKYLVGTRKPKITVKKVAIKGKRAKAYVHSEAQGQAATDDVLGLVKVKAGWRIASLGSGQAATAKQQAPGTGD
jgi:hypothetical protein